MKEILNIVDENDKIIGQDIRTNVHKKGLRHREIWVWLYNDQGEILFQLRPKDAETRPGLLDASAGGHVDLDNDYEQAAVREIKEELGLDLKPEDLIFIAKRHSRVIHEETNIINDKFKKVFAYKFNDSIDKLMEKTQEAAGFEWWPIEKVLNMPEEEKKKFVPTIFKDYNQDLFRKIKTLI